MKKFYLIAVLSSIMAMAHAENTLNLSTYKGTDISLYAGKIYNVSLNRYVFKGWNTISLPFAVSEEILNEVFGSDCRLERLVGVEFGIYGIRLNFEDCKAGGIEPNIPYILYYGGESGVKKIAVSNALILAGESKLSFSIQGTDQVVTMACAQTHTITGGLYGVLSKDNGEATFVNTDNITTGFYATRCYIQLSKGGVKAFVTNHIGKGDVTSIAQVADDAEIVDVYNLSGAIVASQIPASEVKNLQKGIYVIKGKKIIVK